MSAPESPPPSSRSSNRADYRTAFLSRVHRLLGLGYAALRPSDFAHSEEEDITGELCRHIKYLVEEAPTERWMRYYSVHNEDPVDGMRDPKTKATRMGKKRPRLDIRLVDKKPLPNVRFFVEAKRLCRRDSPAKYVDQDGLGAFLSGYYGEASDAYGMLGYIQVHSVSHWLDKLTVKIDCAGSNGSRSALQPLTRVIFNGGPEHVYASRHSGKGKSEIDVYHTLLLFQ